MYRTTYRTRPYVFHRSAAEGGGGGGVQAWWPSPPWKGRCRHRGRALAQQGAFPPVRNVAAICACGLTVCTSPVVACLCDRVCTTRFMQRGYEGDDAGLIRPCWDCGRRTGSWCDGGSPTGKCAAVLACPVESWRPNQATPLCTRCDDLHGRCHSCRGVSGCRPFAWGHPGGGQATGPYSK